jgi:hypothetical protein
MDTCDVTTFDTKNRDPKKKRKVDLSSLSLALYLPR